MVRSRGGARKMRAVRWKIPLLVILFVALVVVVAWLLVENGVVAMPRSHHLEEFSVKDRCAMIAGKLIRTINDEDECTMKCVAQCAVYGKDFSKVSFTFHENDCSTCLCYCT